MRFAFISFFLLITFVPWAYPAEGDSAEALVTKVPIEISSDRLEAEDLAGRVRFFGNVVVRRGVLSLYAPEVEIFYLQQNRDIDRIEASGGVRIVQGERVLTSDSALYFHNEEKVLLRGGARVFRSGDFVEGDEITVLLREEKSVITGGAGSRVNAVFQPKERTP